MHFLGHLLHPCGLPSITWESQGTLSRYSTEKQAGIPGLTLKTSLSFLSHNTDIAEQIIERNPLWREGYRTLYQLAGTTVMVAPSEGLLFFSSVSLLSRTDFLSGQNRPRCPHPCNSGWIPDGFCNRKKRWIDITGLIKFHAGMVEFCWMSFTIILCSRSDPTEIHGGQLFFEQGKDEIKTSPK